MKKGRDKLEKALIGGMLACAILLAVLLPAYFLEFKVNHLRAIGKDNCVIPVEGWALSIQDYQHQVFIITGLGK